MSAPENLTVFNGIDISRLVIVEDVERPVLAKRKLDAKQLPGAQGSYIMARGYETATIKLSCRLRRPRLHDVADTLHELARALQTNEPCKLVLPDDRTRSYMAIYVGGDTFKSDLYKTKFTLTFELADPIAYGAHHKEHFAKKQRVYTGGTYSTRPIVRVVPPQGTTYWEVRNYTTGRYIGVKRNFDGVSQLVIDMQLERATLNKHDAAVDLYSDFFSISTGDVLTATSEYTIEWEERFI